MRGRDAPLEREGIGERIRDKITASKRKCGGCLLLALRSNPIYRVELVLHMDIAGMRAEDFSVEFADGILTISGERTPRREGKRHYHAMEVQVGPFERRFRVPVPVNPSSIHASYEHGFLEVRLTKIPDRRSGPQSVKVT